MAQFGVNGLEGYNITSPGDVCFNNLLKDGDIKKLKKKTTYFVCPKQCLDEFDDFQSKLNEAWDINEIIVIKEEEMKDHLKEKDAAFFSMSIASYGVSFKEAYYQLCTVKDFLKPINNENITEYCRFTQYYTCAPSVKWKSIKNTEELFGYLYSEAKFLNLKIFCDSELTKVLQRI